jgi:hypothetical protein
VGVSGYDYATPASVPEPLSWASMLLGFGVTGYTSRRRRRPIIA